MPKAKKVKKSKKAKEKLTRCILLRDKTSLRVTEGEVEALYTNPNDSVKIVRGKGKKKQVFVVNKQGINTIK